MANIKIRMPAKKLANADVNFISLVERGANRAPFKIQKQERGMAINLGFRNVQKQEVKQPSIVAFVVQKHDAGFESALAAAGAKVDKIVEDGEVVIYQQDADTVLKNDKGEVNQDLLAVRLAPDFAVVMKGFDPSVIGETSFTEILKTQGFMPGFSMAAQALVGSINATMAQAGDRKEAVKSVGEALDEFGAFVHGLVKEIPGSAFKTLESFQTAKSDLDKVIKGLSDAEKAHAATLEGKDRFAFYRASPEDRAKMMGSKDKAKEAPAAEGEKAAPAAAAPAAEEEKKVPFQKGDDKVAKGANGTNADSGKGEGAQQTAATSAVNNGPAGQASSEGVDVKRVDGAGGEPAANAPASGAVSNEGFDKKQADRGGNSGSPVQNNQGQGLANNGIAKEEIAKMIVDGIAASSAATAALVTKTVADALKPVMAQMGELATAVASANATAKQALEQAQKTDKSLGKVVIGGDAGGDPEPQQQQAQKSEGGLGTFDTAYRRDVRKGDKAGAPQRIAARRVTL